MTKVHRNDPCPCGSGKKYKKCCGTGEHARKQRKFSLFQGGQNLFQSRTASPTVSMARHVFKILSSPMGEAKQSAEPEEPEQPKSYNSLEELIGVEGAPNTPA
jgi:hypothetical protein